MSTTPDHQDQSVPKIIRTPNDVIVLVKGCGYNLYSFLTACGVNYNTFHYWKRTGRIPNKSALVLFNYIAKNPTVYGSVVSAGMDVTND